MQFRIYYTSCSSTRFFSGHSMKWLRQPVNIIVSDFAWFWLASIVIRLYLNLDGQRSVDACCLKRGSPGSIVWDVCPCTGDFWTGWTRQKRRGQEPRESSSPPGKTLRIWTVSSRPPLLSEGRARPLKGWGRERPYQLYVGASFSTLATLWRGTHTYSCLCVLWRF